jgi:hypothetical protein
MNFQYGSYRVDAVESGDVWVCLTPEMLDAGVSEWFTWDHSVDDVREIVKGIYVAMVRALAAPRIIETQGPDDERAGG